MRFIGKLLTIYTPSFIKRRALQELFSLTADGFGCSIPHMNGDTYDNCLEQYALFTRNNVLRFIKEQQSLPDVQTKLYNNAYELGEKIKETYHIHSPQDVMEAGKYLYNLLEIEFHGNKHGGITITKCYLSQFFPVEACEIISAVYAGLLAGLQGGGQLVFSSRITEGHTRCKACLLVRELPENKGEISVKRKKHRSRKMVHV